MSKNVFKSAKYIDVFWLLQLKFSIFAILFDFESIRKLIVKNIQKSIVKRYRKRITNDLMQPQLFRFHNQTPLSVNLDDIQ